MARKKKEEEDVYIKNVHCKVCDGTDSVGVYKRSTGEVYGNCFKCNTFFNNPEDNKEEEEIKLEFEDNPIVEDNSILPDDATYHELRSRGIKKDVCEFYHVFSTIDDDGNDLKHYYPHTQNSVAVSWAVRTVANKGFSWITAKKPLEFFGQALAGNGGKMIIVTEGVCDALAAKQMLLDEGKNYRVISIINGASAAVKDFKNNYDWISKFDNIFLAFDQDKPGQDAARKVSEMFPVGKVKNVIYPEKDANDMLLKGLSKEFLKCIYASQELRVEGIKGVEDLYEEAIKPPVMGLSFPWDTLTDVTYGYRRGELWGVGAGSGCGKTEFFKECINHTINHHKLPAGVIFLEEPAAKTLKVLAGKKANKRFHIPSDKGGDWTIDELIDGINDLKGKVYLYEHFGAKDWESIKGKIRFMVNALGIKDIYLDHLTALVAQEDNEYKALNRLMEEMSSLTQELDCTIFYVSHLRKASGTPHEEGGRVTADQFKGSGAIVFWSNFLIGLERDQQAEDDELRNTTTLRVLKDRNTGLATGTTFELAYNHNTGRWMEKDKDDYSTFDE